MKYVYTFLFGLLLILGWIFGFQNRSVLLYPISLKLDLWQVGVQGIPIPLGGVLLIAFFVGMGFTLLALLAREIHLRREIFRKNQELRRTEKEIQKLRREVLEGQEGMPAGAQAVTQSLP